MYKLWLYRRSEQCRHSQEMTIRDALNSAMDEEMSRDPDVFVLGEEVRIPAGPPFNSICAACINCFGVEVAKACSAQLDESQWSVQVGEYQGAYKVSTSPRLPVTWCCARKVRCDLRRPAGVTCNSLSSKRKSLPADHQRALAKVWSRARTRHTNHRGAANITPLVSRGRPQMLRH